MTISYFTLVRCFEILRGFECMIISKDSKIQFEKKKYVQHNLEPSACDTSFSYANF